MIEIKVPELAESITEGTIVKWLVDVGSYVNQGDDLAEIETDKVNIQISAEHSGVVKELKKKVDDTVEVGEVIALLDDQATGKPDGETKPVPVAVAVKPTAVSEGPAAVGKSAEAAPQPAAAAESPIASPAARRLAREKGIDLNAVPTGDPLGRIRAEDVARAGAQPQPEKSVAAPAALPGKPVDRIKMSRRRQTIANRLVAVQHEAAMLTTFNEVDLSAVMAIRKRRKEAFIKQHDVKLGFMSFFTLSLIHISEPTRP